MKTALAVRHIVVSKGKTTDETSYYITSADATAEELLRIVPEHWKIESMHWILDAVFSEDKYFLVSENAHKTLNILRKLALLLRRQYIASFRKKITIKASLLKCSMNDDMLCQLVAGL